MTLDLESLETSFDLLAPRGDELMDEFYSRLFATAPMAPASWWPGAARLAGSELTGRNARPARSGRAAAGRLGGRRLERGLSLCTPHGHAKAIAPLRWPSPSVPVQKMASRSAKPSFAGILRSQPDHS
jgi:hypothetical protein